MTKEEFIIAYNIGHRDGKAGEYLPCDYPEFIEQEPCDTISRQAVLDYIEGSEAELGHSSENELVCQDIKELPSVTPKPCGDSISRQAVLDYINNDLRLGDEEIGNDVERQMELYKSYKYIKSLPPVNPMPKMGYWISIDDNESECSECGHREPNERFIFEDINFCVRCGAKMQEVEE